MKPLFQGIYAIFTGNAPMVAALTGGLHNSVAPPDTAYPYGVFFLVDRIPQDTINETMREPIVQFNIFSDSADTDEISDLADQLEALYDDAELTVTGYTAHFMRIINALMPPSGTERIFQYTLQFQILLQAD
jgi:hypothetical protein